ncbi:hypothetical protein [Paraburkholderia caffeinilytica]|uniref:hypothetical protein n=1 Tax=Paraburkholderia caffeinilytica TaxID=1761016 RepID=UPI0038BA8389
MFFAFHAGGLGFGVFWRCVEECDWGLRGLGFQGFCFYFLFCLIWFVFLVLYLVLFILLLHLFVFCIYYVSGLLALPLCGAALTFFAAAKKDKQRKRLKPLMLSGFRGLQAVVVHLESVPSHIRHQ